MIDDYLLELLKPQKSENDFLSPEDLERAELERIALCDEASLRVFGLWYQFGGMRRPLTPMEAAEMPADLAKDFVYLLGRIRQLADSEIALGQWVSQAIFRTTTQHDVLYPDQTQ
jgi:hypothetical protein